MKEFPTYDVVSKLLHCEPVEGRLYWLERPSYMFSGLCPGGAVSAAQRWNSRLAGKEAFLAVDSTGYKVGKIYGQKFHAHRIVWLLSNGDWPHGIIDHINGDGLDNRISNLRVVDVSGNARNQKLNAKNKSGHVGVFWVAERSKWRASIKASGKSIHLGLFASKEEAVAARASAAEMYGYHPNHGRAA